MFSYIQQFVDERRSGPMVLTGSQNFLLSAKISQSLAGRTAVMELLPFSLAELMKRTALTPAGFEAGEVPTGGPPVSDPERDHPCGLLPADP
ncbi:MAG: AAA family ATPase [bacterium]|nr:AAA family ATPase [bacterium]